ncbi:MAG: Na/Pi cotransporter family protein [Bdellovibrionales bacterium]|nr:Na/Pi cotransporter family protein [Bdellovibrionales bacterium]
MWLEVGYMFFGGLGVFFFGMKTLSEGLQSIAGDFIRKVVNALTTNRLVAVGVGALVTSIVQSSSVTTVMVVGFVNAQLMSLTQAIGVIFGANIGTTITGWIIAVKVGKFGPVFVGLGVFPYMFAKGSDYRAVGRVFIALGLVFMGLELMSEAFKPLRSDPGFKELLVYFTADSVRSYFACVLMGTLLTCVIQSSSAMLGVTVALATTNVITYQTATALVLGENIGTTITALLASFGASSNAKRAARAHALFNLIGVLWISPLFWKYLHFVDWLLPGNPDYVNAEGVKEYVASHIVMCHTMFNVLNTIVFLPFLQPLAKFVTWLTPSPKEKEVAHLRFLSTRIPVGSSTSLALTTAEKELVNLARMVQRTFLLARRYVISEKPYTKVFERIEKYEGITDSIQTEITIYVCKLQEGTLTSEQSAKAYSIIRAADELESIADYCYALARYRNRLTEVQGQLSNEELSELTEYMRRVYSLFHRVERNLGQDVWDMRDIYSRSRKLSEEGNRIRSAHKKRMEVGGSTAISGMLFSDFVVSLRKIRGHVVNLAEALSATPIQEP